MTRTPTPQLSHADRRAQLDALMANHTGPITHITAVKLSPPGARRSACESCGVGALVIRLLLGSFE